MLDEMKTEFEEIEAARNALNEKMLAFRMVHGILLAGRVCWKTDSFANAEKLRGDWQHLTQQLDRLTTKRNDILEKVAIASGMVPACNL
jgi:hypothetical protein